ncbi:alpha/beta hydrolase [Intrasporangium sp.]|uniref:alpha/beta fold hydrolase n=1 Tax=Intrasporangium sp. TaxID=1925024 RepID=UPI003221F281
MSYQQCLRAARERLAAVPRRTIEIPPYGTVEYADDGHGMAALVSHPLFGGFDLGLAIGRKWLGPDLRIIGPSRFGYLGSTLPRAASPADQADAFIALLDMVGLDQVVVLGYSAGGPPVIQLALSYPDRVLALVLVASALPGAAGAPPPKLVANLLIGSDLVFWLLGLAGPSLTARVLGMDKHFRPVGSQCDSIQDAWTSLFPIAPRRRGALHDLYVSNPDVQGYPLEAITVPTLIISARDDAMSAYGNAERAALRIPGSRLESFDHGGHLLLDQDVSVRRSVAMFVEGATAAHQET